MSTLKNINDDIYNRISITFLSISFSVMIVILLVYRLSDK